MTSAIEKAKRELDNLLMDICEELGFNYDRYERIAYPGETGKVEDLPEKIYSQGKYSFVEFDSIKGRRWTTLDNKGNILYEGKFK